MSGRLPMTGVVALVLASLTLAVAGAASARGTDVARTKAEPKQLVIAINQGGEIYDPTSVLPSTISVVAANVFDWLMWRTPSGKLVPSVATAWDLSPDGKTLSLTLRKNVRFSNGDLLTATDVVFSWNRLKANGFSDRIARTLTSWEVVDPTHLIAHFAAPEIGFIPSGGFPIVDHDYWQRVGEAAFKANPIGSGPYKISKIAAGQYVDLERNPSYWGKKGKTAGVRFQTILDDTTRIASLKTGAADVVMQVPYQNVDPVNKTKGLKTVTLVPAGSTVYLAFKAQSGATPWKNPLVRQAVALAINRSAIVKKLLKGIPVSYPFLAPTDLGYDFSISHYPFNVAKAKELLTQAGYPSGFSTELPYLNAQTGMSETAQAVALYLAQVGIKVTPKPLTGADFVPWVFKAAHDPSMDYIAMFLGAVAGKAEPATALLNSFSSVTPFAWYNNPQANGLILRANATVDDAARAALLKQAQNIIHDDYGFVPLWNSAMVYGMKSCIQFTPQLGDIDLLLLRHLDATRCRG